MKIFVAAPAATPDDGATEAAISWNWVIALARSGEDMTVVTSERHRAAIERWLSIHREVIIEFRYVPLTGSGRLASLVWQARVFMTLYRGDWRDFDLIHHLSPRSIRSWSFLWLLRRPFVFGPASGGERAPFALVASMGSGPLLLELLRRGALILSFIDPVFLAMQARALRVLATSADTRERLCPAFRTKADIGVAIGAGRIDYRDRPAQQPVRVLAAGPAHFWGGGALFAEVAAELGSRHRRYTISFEAAPSPDALAHADIFVSLNLRDADGAAIAAAMAAGLPVVCLDRAAAPVVAGDAAVIVDTTDKTSQEVVRDIADVIVRLAENPDLRREMARRSREQAALLGWERTVRLAYAPILAALRA